MANQQLNTKNQQHVQSDLDFWLASLVLRGRDHTPEWVTVSKLLRLGANPTIRPMGHRGLPLPSAIETCQEMIAWYDPITGKMARPENWRSNPGSPERVQQICAKTQAYFQKILNQFIKAGYGK